MNHSVKVTACIGWMCWGLTGAASAATNYWDTNGAAEGFGTAGGTWGVEPFWSSDATGLSAPAVTHTTASDDLVFGTRQHGLAAGTLAVDGSAQAFRSLRFGAASGPVTITGTNTHVGPVTVAAGTLALDAAGALNAGNALILAGGALAMGSHSNAEGKAVWRIRRAIRPPRLCARLPC